MAGPLCSTSCHRSAAHLACRSAQCRFNACHLLLPAGAATHDAIQCVPPLRLHHPRPEQPGGCEELCQQCSAGYAGFAHPLFAARGRNHGGPAAALGMPCLGCRSLGLLQPARLPTSSMLRSHPLLVTCPLCPHTFCALQEACPLLSLPRRWACRRQRSLPPSL